MEKTQISKDALIEQVVQKLFATRDEIETLATELSGQDADSEQKFETVREVFDRQLKALRELVPKGAEGDAARIALDDIEESLSRANRTLHNGLAPQTQNFLISLNKVEVNPKRPIIRAITEFEHEFEKFKLKARIISLKLTLGKFIVSDRFHKSLNEASSKIHRIGSSLSRKATGRKAIAENIEKEVVHVYMALQKAVSSLAK